MVIFGAEHLAIRLLINNVSKFFWIFLRTQNRNFPNFLARIKISRLFYKISTKELSVSVFWMIGCGIPLIKQNFVWQVTKYFCQNHFFGKSCSCDFFFILLHTLVKATCFLIFFQERCEGSTKIITYTLLKKLRKK